jgi:hypothetical protein
MIGRWRQSTAYTDMTLAQQGAYRNLLDEVVVRPDGIIPDASLAKASGSPAEWPSLAPVVMKWMRKVHGGWTNDVAIETKTAMKVTRVDAGVGASGAGLVTVDRAICPDCSRVGTLTRTMAMGTRPEAWYCNPKFGGCSSNFKLDDESILGQLTERVAAPIRKRVASGRVTVAAMSKSEERTQANQAVFAELRQRIGAR